MTKLQDEFKKIGDEWANNGYERRKYTNDYSLNGCKMWGELWARGIELGKQYYKLKAKLEADANTVGL